MKRILSALTLLLTLLPIASIAQNIKPEKLPAMETFIMVTYPQPGVASVLVREYVLSSDEDDKGMGRQVARLEKLAQDKSLLRQRFGIKKVTVAQEMLSRDRGFLIAEYIFGLQVSDKAGFLEELYSALLGTDVNASVNNDEVRIQFIQTTRSVMQQNGKGAFQRGNETLVIWPANLQNQELLIAPVGIVKENYQSLAPFLSTDTSGFTALNQAGTNDRLQHDFDLARLQDLLTLSQYIEQYHELTGRFPLQGESELPNYSIIATREQQKYVPTPSFPHKVSDITALVSELQTVLGDDLVMPFDPQRVPVNKPNFYIYRIEGETWFLTIHLHEAFPFTASIAEGNNKLELTNSNTRAPGQWLPGDLDNESSFQEALSRQAHQPGYVDKLRSNLGANAAF